MRMAGGKAESRLATSCTQLIKCLRAIKVDCEPYVGYHIKSHQERRLLA